MKKALFSPILFRTSIFWIVALGAFLRILFILKGGAIYYGKVDFWHLGGDTQAWFNSFMNLYKHGIYTLDLNVENGKFFRPPGYAFIMGFLYLLCGQQTPLMETTLICLQTSLDIASIYLIYRIGWQTFGNKLYCNIVSILYACYPFIIVWVPVLYAESISVFFLLLCFYFFTKDFTVRTCFLSAFFLGIASLIRLQCLPMFGVLFLVILFTDQTLYKVQLKYLFYFTFSFSISYGLWPLRNYFFQNRIVFTQDLNVGGHWSKDYFALISYLYTIQVDIQPQKEQLVGLKKATWPQAAIIDKSDSYLLDSLSELCRNCGTGLSFFRLHAGISNYTIPKKNNCDSVIEAGFNYLALKQKEKNKWHYYVQLPIGNLKKAIFKSSLYGNKTWTVKLISSLLFGLRTILIFLGIIGLIIGGINKTLSRNFLIAIILYTTLWYFYMSFIFRQMEIRYLLHADILLLFPAAYLIYAIIKYASLKNTFSKKS